MRSTQCACCHVVQGYTGEGGAPNDSVHQFLAAPGGPARGTQTQPHRLFFNATIWTAEPSVSRLAGVCACVYVCCVGWVGAGPNLRRATRLRRLGLAFAVSLPCSCLARRPRWPCVPPGILASLAWCAELEWTPPGYDGAQTHHHARATPAVLRPVAAPPPVRPHVLPARPRLPHAQAPWAEALLVGPDGFVAAAGSLAEARAAAAAASVEEHDLGGLFVLPGFVDTHVHLVPAGLLLGMLNLGGVASRQQFQEAAAAKARELLTEEGAECQAAGAEAEAEAGGRGGSGEGPSAAGGHQPRGAGRACARPGEAEGWAS